MKSFLNRFAANTAIGGAALLLFGFGCYVMGVRINTTRSIPVGLYLTSSKPIEKGAYVLFCPPPGKVFDEAKQRGYFGAGFCPGDYGFLMKKVLAGNKDSVVLADDGVHVNGKLLAFSLPLKADKQGRSLPVLRGEYELGESDVLLMTDGSALSFDSRYFGIVNRSQIRGVIRPIYTW
jgi:conjugative transfer signal peptidase TraF